MMNDNVIFLMDKVRKMLEEYVVVMTRTYDESVYDKYMESFIELSVYMREVYHEISKSDIYKIRECNDSEINKEYLIFRGMYNKLEH